MRFRGWALALWLLAPRSAAAADGALVVRAATYGLTIAVDRRPVGTTPVQPVSVAPGFHLVEALRGGRPVWARLVFVGAGESLDVDVDVAPAPVIEAPPVAEAARAPRFDLTGDVALTAARLGADRDLDLRQDWRLSGEGAGLDGALRLRAASDLDGGGAEDPLRGLHDVRGAPTEIALEEAWVGGSAGAARLEGGRLPATGPGGVALVVDGARARVSAGGLALAGIGGWRADPPYRLRGARGLGGAGLELRAGPASGFVRYLYHRAHHLDAGATVEAGPLSLSADGRAVDDAPAEAGGLAALDVGAGRVWASARRRFGASGPFEDPARLLGLLLPPPPAGWEAAVGASAPLGGATLHLMALGREPDARDPAFVQATADLLQPWGAWTFGATGEAIAAEATPGPALRRSARGGLSAAFDVGGWRGQGAAGLRRLRAADDAGRTTDRWLPEGSLRLGRSLDEDLEAYVAADARAVSPAWWPGGGPLTTLTLGVTLR
jgi:hypothetical protein